jgi:flagellar basal body-associated protein FliL
MLAKTRIKAEEPTKTMTWIVIFIIIIFTGLLAGVLFFTWHRQARITKEELLSAKKSAFPEAGSKEEKENKEKD